MEEGGGSLEEGEKGPWAILGFEGGVSWDTGVQVCLHACWIFFTLTCPLLYLYIF